MENESISTFRMMNALKLIIKIIAIALTVLLSYELFAEAGVVFATLLGSIPASSTATIPLTYVPQFVTFVTADAPTQLQFKVLGDGVIKDLDTNGIAVENNLLSKEIVTNGYLIQLADGFIGRGGPKNAQLTIANAGAAALEVYGYSQRQGQIYVQTIQQQVLANSGQRFTDFAYLGMPSFVQADNLQITYQDGHVDTQVGPTEVRAAQQVVQANLALAIANFEQTIKAVDLIPAATQSIYVMKFVPASGIVPPTA